MFKIKDTTIHCSRGDCGTISLKIPFVDVNNYIKYEDDDVTPNIYWYDKENKVLYDSDYNVSQVSLDTLTMVIYQFKQGDKITFNVYNKNGYNIEPALSKDIVIESASDSVDIPLTEEEGPDSRSQMTLSAYLISESRLQPREIILNCLT